MAFVALGTIADVMPLTKTNRLLVKAGFEVLCSDDCPHGLKNLFSKSCLSRSAIVAEDISFSLAPAINAAGRLGHPEVALFALISDEENGKKYTEKLITLNSKRKTLCKNDLESALSYLSIKPEKRIYSIILDGDFHEGLLGITASRLVDIYHVRQ